MSFRWNENHWSFIAWCSLSVIQYLYPIVNHRTPQTPTSVAVQAPRGWIGRVRQAHIVLGKDTEMVLSPGDNVVDCVCVAKEAVCYVLPHPGAGLVLRHDVVQAVVQLLVRGRGPGENHFALDRLLDLYRPGALGLVWEHISREILSGVLNTNELILCVGPLWTLTCDFIDHYFCSPRCIQFYIQWVYLSLLRRLQSIIFNVYFRPRRRAANAGQ